MVPLTGSCKAAGHVLSLVNCGAFLGCAFLMESSLITKLVIVDSRLVQSSMPNLPSSGCARQLAAQFVGVFAAFVAFVAFCCHVRHFSNSRAVSPAPTRSCERLGFSLETDSRFFNIIHLKSQELSNYRRTAAKVDVWN